MDELGSEGHIPGVAVTGCGSRVSHPDAFDVAVNRLFQYLRLLPSWCRLVGSTTDVPVRFWVFGQGQKVAADQVG